MNRFLLIFTVFQIYLIHHGHAQSIDESDLQSIIEARFNTQEESSNSEDLFERLLLIYENPININTATAEEMQGLFMLSARQIASLQNYIQVSGKLLTLFELQFMKGFDEVTINKLLPFITIDFNKDKIDDRSLLRKILTERNNYFLLRFEQGLETKKGFKLIDDETQPAYIGTPLKVYLRYRVAKSGDFSLGFTTEKDAGERFQWRPSDKKFGSDFWSVHFMKENIGRWKRVIIGDYQLQFGQGLLFGAGLNTGKGAAAVSGMKRYHTGIRPYTSVVESGFLRGMAASYKLSDELTLTSFLSYTPLDGNVKIDIDSSDSSVSSILNTGFHRTESELNNKHQLSEAIYGITLDHKPNDFKRIGFIAAASHLSLPVSRADQPYNKFDFSGRYNYNLGLYGNFNWKQFDFFGEAAISKSGGKGIIFGFTTSLSDRVELAMVVRNYQRDFHALKGASLAEGSRNINESGQYTGMKYTWNNQLNITAYYDTFKFPWLRFQVDNPSSGSDYMVRLNYTPKRHILTYLQYRKKKKEVNYTLPDLNQRIVTLGTKQQWLLNLALNHQALRLKSRIQYSNYTIQGERSEGIAFIQDATMKLDGFSISTRVALFDTNGNQNRQYVYERDVLYAFSIPAYSGRGIRNYILLNHKISRRADIWFRVARTTFYDRDTIGTGLDTIEGNKRTDVKFQIRYKIN
ncbi:ComEA family DNA-binding protein [Roseivirga misakiensis]|uniref:Helix-hairpin-helix DNA-binding motif class 1 domain-containing protein n=1 Tax=Roseivirga misakiensis TaxID=1563681 RepID=A0A1E5SLF2_9BACT|nr:helix-hairpin-helix domain-containing protein [Roseivirga misakiensis]OEJ99955.1 hypothetical protein BFP71_10450 [Roseivirga misakiensis]